MTTTETLSPEEIGRKLAELAVNVNDYGPPTYRKYLDAFLEAHFAVQSISEMWENTYEVDILAKLKDGFDRRIEELLEQYQL